MRTKMIKLAKLSSSTAGCTFMMSHTQGGEWKIHFPALNREAVANTDPEVAVDEAIKWIEDNREPKPETAVKYKLKDNTL